MPTRRILIYRLGSLGDTISALPALQIVASRFSNSERWMLTNFRVSEKAPPMAEILNGTGLIHNYIEYPIGLRNPLDLFKLRKKIRKLQTDTIVYLPPPRRRMQINRDICFFRWCGINNFVGIPKRQDLRTRAKMPDGRYEYEGSRLCRCLTKPDEKPFFKVEDFQLDLSSSERSAAHQALHPAIGNQPILAASIGAKTDVQRWGYQQWRELFKKTSKTLPDWTLVMIGSSNEYDITENLIGHWTGPTLNLCGKLTVRESAAVLEQAKLFVGHDSGPMHMAAATGLPCVAIFSSHNPPGVWFPPGEYHQFLYHNMPCQGCGLSKCNKYDKACIRSITTEEVLDAILNTIRHLTET